MRALVLSGGGAKGAYQVGALRYLLGVLEIDYDAYLGISVGALNTSLLSMYPSGQEKDAIEHLEALWDGIEGDKSIYKNRYPFGRKLSAALSIITSPSVYNSTPLLKLISDNLDIERMRSSGKILQVGAVSKETNEYKLFDQNHPYIIEAVGASSSYPLLLNPVEIDGEMWYDAGVREVTPLEAAINLGATEIDVIMASPPMDTHHAADANTVLSDAPEVLSAMMEEISQNDTKIADLTNDLIHFTNSTRSRSKIRVLRPSRSLRTDALSFDPKKIKENREFGFMEAQEMVWT